MGDLEIWRWGNGEIGRFGDEGLLRLFDSLEFSFVGITAVGISPDTE